MFGLHIVLKLISRLVGETALSPLIYLRTNVQEVERYFSLRREMDKEEPDNYEEVLQGCLRQAFPQFILTDSTREKLFEGTSVVFPRYFVLLPVAPADLGSAIRAIKLLFEQQTEDGKQLPPSLFEFSVFTNVIRNRLEPTVVEKLCGEFDVPYHHTEDGKELEEMVHQVWEAFQKKI